MDGGEGGKGGEEEDFGLGQFFFFFFFFFLLFQLCREKQSLSLSLSVSPSVFPPASSSHLQVVRGRAQKVRVAVVGRFPAPEFRDLAHRAADREFLFVCFFGGEKRFKVEKNEAFKNLCLVLLPPSLLFLFSLP